jgi:DNA-binding winged helix-turn-helix (wHTH) protein
VVANPTKTQDIIQFVNDFELNLRAYELRRHGRPVKLERLPMDVLILLIDRPGELVTRDQNLFQKGSGDRSPPG